MSDPTEVRLSVEVTKGTAAKFFMAALGFVGTVVFARILGPTAFGGFYLLLSVVQIAERPLAGLGVAAKKRFSESGSDRERIVGTFLAVYVAAIVAALVVAIAANGPLESYTGLPNSGLLFFLLFTSLALFGPLQTLLSGTGMVGLTTWIDALRSVFTLPLQLLFVLTGLGAAGMAYGLTAATLLTVPITYYYLRTVPARPTRDALRSLYRFARYSVPSSVVGKAYDRYDTLLIGLLLTPAVVGYYEVAFKLTLPAMFVASVAGSGMMARVSNLHSREDDVRTDITNALAFSSLVSIPLFFGAAAIATPVVVTVYGPAYADAALYLVGLAFYMAFRSQTSPMTSAISGVDRPDLTLRISAATLGLNVVLGYLLAVRIGGIGVVIATIVSELFRYSLCRLALRRAVPGIDLLPRPLAMQCLSGLLMFGFATALANLVAIRSWLHLLSVVVPSAAVYFGVVLLLSGQVRRTTRGIVGPVYREVVSR